MAMFPWLRPLIWLVVLAIAVVAGSSWLRTWLNRVQVPADFEDMSGIEAFSGHWLAPGPWRAGDLVAYRTGERKDDIGFGVVVALGGDRLRVSEGRLLVNGQAAGAMSGAFPGTTEAGPLTIPDGHLYVVSTHHRYDSLALGTIAPDQVLGRVE